MYVYVLCMWVRLGHWSLPYHGALSCQGLPPHTMLHSLTVPHPLPCQVLPWRHWILSGYATKLGMIATALEAGYPSVTWYPSLNSSPVPWLSTLARYPDPNPNPSQAGYPAGSAARNHSLVVLRTATPRDFEHGRLFVGRCERREPVTAHTHAAWRPYMHSIHYE